MREIKFRCWQVEEFDEEDNPVKWEMIPADCLAFEEYEPLIDLLQSNEHKILMQYTGLKDKNGKECYEGDIIIIQLGEKHKANPVVVEWGIAGYKYCTMFEYGHSFEIIGNIYENPELLNSDKKDKRSVASKVDSSNTADTIERENYEYERGNE